MSSKRVRIFTGNPQPLESPFQGQSLPRLHFSTSDRLLNSLTNIISVWHQFNDEMLPALQLYDNALSEAKEVEGDLQQIQTRVRALVELMADVKNKRQKTETVAPPPQLDLPLLTPDTPNPSPPAPSGLSDSELMPPPPALKRTLSVAPDLPPVVVATVVEDVKI